MRKELLLPHFLIIGAMKAGTSTLHRDLNCHPHLFLPEHKEPDSLCTDDVLSELGKKAYGRLFAKAKVDQVRGEASTAYTKLPDFDRVPERALQVLGPRTKIIYLVRDPIRRLVSHHHHDYRLGRVSNDPNAALFEHTKYVDYSRYGMQVQPWLELFGRDNILFVTFEEYVKDRVEVVKRVCSFLGVGPQGVDLETGRVFNESATKTIPPDKVRMWITNTDFYKNSIKQRLPWRLRSQLGVILARKRVEEPVKPLTTDSLSRIKSLLVADISNFRSMSGNDYREWTLFWSTEA